MPKDPNATIIMVAVRIFWVNIITILLFEHFLNYLCLVSLLQLATGTGIAPFRSFVWKMFFEKHDDYKVGVISKAYKTN